MTLEKIIEAKKIIQVYKNSIPGFYNNIISLDDLLFLLELAEKHSLGVENE